MRRTVLTLSSALALVVGSLGSTGPVTAVAPTHVPPITGPISYARTHHDYPAADIFPAGRCGATVVSPVAGKVVQVRRTDRWQAATDNPAWRGGKTIAIRGADGVRYYLAHLASINAEVVVGKKVSPGQPVAKVGRTGRAGACHLHFALSIPCPRLEWSVRRGVIWPQVYLDAWSRGRDLSPAPALTSWKLVHPGACRAAAAEAHAGEA